MTHPDTLDPAQELSDAAGAVDEAGLRSGALAAFGLDSSCEVAACDDARARMRAALARLEAGE